MPLVSSVSDRIIACDLGRVVVDGDGRLVRNHPARRRVVPRIDPRGHRAFRSEPGFEHHRSGRGGTSMTQTETEAPQFKARRRAGCLRGPQLVPAHPPQVHELVQRRAVIAVLGAVAPREEDAEVALHRHDHLHGGLAPGHEPHAGHDRQRDREPGRAAVGLPPLHHVLGPLGDSSSRWRSSRSPIVSRTRSSSTCGCGSTRTSSRPTCAALDQVATGQLVTRSLTDIQLVDTLLKTFPQLIGYAPILLSVAIIVTIINPIMGVLSILALPINVWLVNKFRSRLRALSWAELNERAEVTTRHRRARPRHPRGQGVRP